MHTCTYLLIPFNSYHAPFYEGLWVTLSMHITFPVAMSQLDSLSSYNLRIPFLQMINEIIYRPLEIILIFIIVFYIYNSSSKGTFEHSLYLIEEYYH